MNIVLVEPEIPQNTGNIARTCTAIGAKLHIVKPIPFDIGEKAVKRAGLDYWQYLNLEIHKSLTDFMSKYSSEQLFFCSTKASKLYTKVSYPQNVFLMFGAETRDLPNDLIFRNKGTAVTIPMKKDIRSLNLSNAVAIVAYEVVRQQGISSIF